MEMCKFEFCISGFQPQTPNANHANRILRLLDFDGLKHLFPLHVGFITR